MTEIVIPTNKKLDLVAILKERRQTLDTTTIASVNATVYLQVTGEGGGEWCLSIVDSVVSSIVQLSVSENSPVADINISVDIETWWQIYRGTVKTQFAVLKGKLRIRGNKMLALKLIQVLQL